MNSKLRLTWTRDWARSTQVWMLRTRGKAPSWIASLDQLPSGEGVILSVNARRLGRYAPIQHSFKTAQDAIDRELRSLIPPSMELPPLLWVTGKHAVRLDLAGSRWQAGWSPAWTTWWPAPGPVWGAIGHADVGFRVVRVST